MPQRGYCEECSAATILVKERKSGVTHCARCGSFSVVKRSAFMVSVIRRVLLLIGFATLFIVCLAFAQRDKVKQDTRSGQDTPEVRKR